MAKRVFISGVTGMDGSHMADYLLENTDYEIYGGVRRKVGDNYDNIRHLLDNKRFHLIRFDLCDPFLIESCVKSLRPEFFYNFAANSYVGESWDAPVSYFQYNTLGVLYILEAIRKFSPLTRFYQAGSSEQWGNVEYSPQDEKHPIKPRSPYGASKASAGHIVKVYRESYGLYAVQGILFNHESERRGEEFVTRKITKGVADIYYQLDTEAPFEPIRLGNIYAKRDWSYAPDFIGGIVKIMHQEWANSDIQPKSDGSGYHAAEQIQEYVLSSQETHTIKEFVEKAFESAGIFGEWEGEGINEQYVSTSAAREVLVKIDPEFYRPAEVGLLLGDSSKARKELFWKPQFTFDDLVKKMVTSDIETRYKDFKCQKR